MQFHYWKYVSFHKWYCENCKGKTDNPTKGDAAKKTCPGKKGK